MIANLPHAATMPTLLTIAPNLSLSPRERSLHASDSQSMLPPLPFGLDYHTPLLQKSAPQLLIELLPLRDPEIEFYKTSDVAQVFQMSSNRVRKHVKKVWPEKDGHTKLNFADTCTLIKRIWFNGRPKVTINDLRAAHQHLRQQRDRDELTLADIALQSSCQ